MKRFKKGSFVAISDFHSYKWPLEKVKNHYINEYETIYILGDATDRGEHSDGTGGLSLLFEIKELTEKYPGRVVYIPGNHDDFLYQYAKYNDYGAKVNMIRNHGAQTVEDIDNLKRHSSRKLKDLIDWLGNLPLQKEHYFEGKRYVLAHALFNEKLYKENKNFSLEDYRRSGGYSGKHRNIIWFRKNDDYYDRTALPRRNSIMIIGHTPLKYRENENLDLKNSYGETVPVKCVDGGIAYDGRMLKYVGGQEINHTIRGEHIDTSEYIESVNPKKENNQDKNHLETNVNKIILMYINNSSTLEEAIIKLMNVIYSIGTGYFNINGRIRERVSKEEVKKYLEEVYMSYIPTNGNTKDIDFMEIFKLYFTKVALDYITMCQYKKFGTKKRVVDQMESLINENNYNYVTESVGKARSITAKVGINNIVKWYNQSDYKSYEEYVSTTLGRQYKK